jgi:PTH1 family peptidyl-tRNA hydrolase
VADRFEVKLKRGPLRVRSEVASVPVAGAILASPNVFMNDSGRAVGSLRSYYKVDLEDLFVLHDDIDLAFGRPRVQKAGGSGGHNGIRSLEQHLGTKDFWRLKLGVGRPPGSQDAAEHVLKRFTKSERPEVDLMVDDAADVSARMAARRGDRLVVVHASPVPVHNAWGEKLRRLLSDESCGLARQGADVDVVVEDQRVSPLLAQVATERSAGARVGRAPRPSRPTHPRASAAGRPRSRSRRR